MAYLQVRTRTCSTFLISHHTSPARFLLHSTFLWIQLLQKKKKKKSDHVTLLEKKFSTKLHGQISDKNRTKNHESNTKITAQNVESSRRALYKKLENTQHLTFREISHEDEGLYYLPKRYVYVCVLCIYVSVQSSEWN